MRFLLAGALLCSSLAAAAPRPFAWTWDGTTLSKGGREIYGSSALRFSRGDVLFVRTDQRLGIGFGLNSAVETQVLLDFSTVATGIDGKAATAGLTSLTRARFFDAKTDALGVFALVAGTAGLDALGFELRLGFDKQLGPLLLALNAGLERRFLIRALPGELADFRLEQSLGASWAIGPSFGFGLEARNRIAFAGGSYLGSALYAGMNLFVRKKSWWLNLGFFPQVMAVKAEDVRGNGEPLEVRDNERFNLQLSAGFDVG